jgi:hypothetical protein
LEAALLAALALGALAPALARAGLVFAALVLASAAPAFAALALLAAFALSLRRLGRCGRVRGSEPSTPGSLCSYVPFSSLMRVS